MANLVMATFQSESPCAQLEIPTETVPLGTLLGRNFYVQDALPQFEVIAFPKELLVLR